MSAFSLAEVFRLAEEIERNGYDFYSGAVKSAGHPECRDVFRSLAEQEKMHESLFARWRQEICGAEDAQVVDPDGQAEAYLRSIADNHVFTLNKDIARLLASIQTPLSLVEMAIGFEKDTIKFFSSLKEHVGNNTRHGVELLINEENRHIQLLTDLKKKLER